MIYVTLPGVKTAYAMAEWEVWLDEHVDDWQWTRDSFYLNKDESSRMEYIAGIYLHEEDAMAFKIKFGL